MGRRDGAQERVIDLTIQEFFNAVPRYPIYWAALIFYGTYPVFSSIMWVTTAFQFFARRERDDREKPEPLEHYPFVTVLIPAYCEAKVIRDSLEAATRIDYPEYEVVVVDDASTDETKEVVREFVRRGDVRLIAKATNEGKAMALNDALPCIRGDLILIMDADAEPDPQILRWMVPHFRSSRVAGVTGNPRVSNRETFLSQLQVVEFTSIVSMLRRAQRVWGRILTMSGVVGAFRKSALLDVGRYSPEMATEDIELTWRLQRAYYDVRYEPRGIVWMRVPSTLRGLVDQRRRWALGLAQVLRRHGGLARSWQNRRMWPVFWEAVVSILWAYTFILLTAFWLVSYAVGVPPIGVSPIPNWWGMTIATMCLLQLLSGVVMDFRYDRSVARHFVVAVTYPMIYWMLMSAVTAITTPRGLLRSARRGSVTQWKTAR